MDIGRGYVGKSGEEREFWGGEVAMEWPRRLESLCSADLVRVM